MRLDDRCFSIPDRSVAGPDRPIWRRTPINLTELAGLDATAQADLVRNGDVTLDRTRRGRDRGGRTARPAAGRRVHPHASARPGARPDGVAGRTVSGRPDPGQGHRAGAGGLPVRPRRAAAAARPRARLGPHHLPGRRTARRRLRLPGPQHVGAAGRRAGRLRPRTAHDAPQPLEHRPRHRRIEQRVRRGRRRRPRPAGPRQRRRRFPAHTGRAVRGGRPQAHPGAGLPRPAHQCRQLRRACLDRGVRPHPDGARHRRDAAPAQRPPPRRPVRPGRRPAHDRRRRAAPDRDHHHPVPGGPRAGDRRRGRPRRHRDRRPARRAGPHGRSRSTRPATTSSPTTGSTACPGLRRRCSPANSTPSQRSSAAR